ncbi:MAG: DUF1707 domain-containing protein, partial [Solirubrobacterales bacterium]|nr:DUF1707 domain-containing protein [Solirubrobacterales bacterium]
MMLIRRRPLLLAAVLAVLVALVVAAVARLGDPAEPASAGARAGAPATDVVNAPLP